jgi:hypothetical protein
VRQIPEHPRKDTTIPDDYLVYKYETVMVMGLPIVSQGCAPAILAIYRWATPSCQVGTDICQIQICLRIHDVRTDLEPGA